MKSGYGERFSDRLAERLGEIVSERLAETFDESLREKSGNMFGRTWVTGCLRSRGEDG